MRRTCVSCQRELPPGARRCDYCGSLQPPDTTRPRRDQPGEAAPPGRSARATNGSENGRTRRGQALRAGGRCLGDSANRRVCVLLFVCLFLAALWAHGYH